MKTLMMAIYKNGKRYGYWKNIGEARWQVKRPSTSTM